MLDIKIIEKAWYKNESRYEIKENLNSLNSLDVIKTKANNCNNNFQKKKSWFNYLNWLIKIKASEDFYTVMEFYTPFYHYFLPYVSKMVNEEIYIKKNSSLEIKKDIIDDIVSQLSKEFSFILEKEFSLFRIEYILELEKSEKEIYLLFCKKLHKNPNSIFTKYPVFARLFSQIISNTKDNLEIFFMRFEKDLDKIEKLIARNKLTLKKIELFNSDPHNNYKTVFKITLNESNLCLFYKLSNGKTLNFHEKVSNLLEENGIFISTPKFLVIDENYFWVLEVKETPNFEKLFLIKNLGSLLGYCYCTNTYDIHMGNVIFRNNTPVIIDHEVSLLPITQKLWKKKLTVIESLNLLRIGILPNSFRTEIDFSILSKEITGSLKEHNFYNINTNLMGLKSEDVKFSEKNKLGIDLTLPEIAELKRGFIQIYIFFQKNRTRIESIIEENTETWSGRSVFRNTSQYFKILNYLKQPTFFEDGLIRSNILESLFYGTRKIKIKQSHLIKEEINSILNLDIPYFHSKINDKYVYSNQIKLKGIIKINGIESVKLKLSQLDYIDLKNQLNIINKSFNHLSIENLSIKKILIKNSISIYDTNYWLNQDLNLSKDSFPFDNKLYNGNSGIYLYLALDNVIHPDKETEKNIRNYIKYLDFYIENRWEIISKNVGIINGISSIIYFLIKLNQINISYKTIILIEKILKKIKLKDYNQFDLSNGKLGLLLCLCFYKEHFLSSKFSKITNAIIDDLLDNTVLIKDIGLSSDESSEIIKTGFSHGLSGIIFSLMRYASISNYRIEEVMSYINNSKLIENDFYSENSRNWVDQRKIVSNYDSYSWCHGAPGIHISRSMFTESFKISDYEFEKYIEKNMLTSLCCGKLGIIDILFTFASKSNDEKLKTKIANYFNSNFNNMKNELAKNHNLSLFNGLTGLGYLELKINHNLQIDKSILMFE